MGEHQISISSEARSARLHVERATCRENHSEGLLVAFFVQTKQKYAISGELALGNDRAPIRGKLSLGSRAYQMQTSQACRNTCLGHVAPFDCRRPTNILKTRSVRLTWAAYVTATFPNGWLSAASAFKPSLNLSRRSAVSANYAILPASSLLSSQQNQADQRFRVEVHLTSACWILLFRVSGT